MYVQVYKECWWPPCCMLILPLSTSTLLKNQITSHLEKMNVNTLEKQTLQHADTLYLNVCGKLFYLHGFRDFYDVSCMWCLLQLYRTWTSDGIHSESTECCFGFLFTLSKHFCWLHLVKVPLTLESVLLWQIPTSLTNPFLKKILNNSESCFFYRR